MKIGILDSSNNLPLLVEPDTQGECSNIDTLLLWYKENSQFIENKLLLHGAILFRGFSVNTMSVFENFVRTVSGNLGDYVDGNSPRTKLTQGIYTSTEYPAEYSISLHNELSYSHKWPDRLYFCCISAPSNGGETPIADSRKILKSLSPNIVEEFTSKQVRYIRNLHSDYGLGVSWQDTFETSNKLLVEDFCIKNNIDFEWKKNGSLRISHIRPAIATHPKTGEAVWFNQADQFHP